MYYMVCKNVEQRILHPSLTKNKDTNRDLFLQKIL